MQNTRVHLPISYGVSEAGRKVDIPTSLPVIFSAGPIRNATKWHDRAIHHALKRDESVFFACPARPSELSGDALVCVEKDDLVYETFPRQRAWEQKYLDQAADAGCIFFWLCKEAENPEHVGKVYAHITMLELGGWIKQKKIFPETRLVIGTDGDFPEWSTILFEIETEIPSLPVYYSLEETVSAALRIALS